MCRGPTTIGRRGPGLRPLRQAQAAGRLGGMSKLESRGIAGAGVEK